MIPAPWYTCSVSSPYVGVGKTHEYGEILLPLLGFGIWQILKICRAFLVAQWLRIHLPVQGTRVRALVREDPTCRGATKAVRPNY